MDETARQAGNLMGPGQGKVGDAADMLKSRRLTVQRACLRNKLPRLRKHRRWFCVRQELVHRIMSLWDSLPRDVVMGASLDAFKRESDTFR